MGRFTLIPQDTFSQLQTDAGILVKNFDPANPSATTAANIICPTTGGINAQCVPTYSDMGEDVDNCPVNMKELKHLDGWDCKLAFTSLGTSPESIKLALGAADRAGSHVIPRRTLQQTDFEDLWWVGDRADGGFLAVKLHHALSTGGFSLQTTKNSKGQISMEITGHVSIDAQNVVPMEFYSADPEMVTVTQTLSHVTSSFTGNKTAKGLGFYATLTPASGYALGTGSVTMGGTDITSTVYNDGVISIPEVTGALVITNTGTAVT